MSDVEAMRQNRGVSRVSVATFEGTRLRTHLDERGWSIERLAARAGLRPTAVGTYAAGSRRPSPSALVALATALDVPTTDLAPLSSDPVLHELRWHSGMTVSALAHHVGMSDQQLGSTLRGAVPLPNDARQRRRLASALNIDGPRLQAAWAASRRALDPS